jgi:hypothetical protein
MQLMCNCLVSGLSEHVATSATSLMSLLSIGNARRCTARTGDHARSSRSHAVFTVSCAELPGGSSARRAHLVDLAGSERAESTSRARREEGASINKSLVTLGNVISALGESSLSRNGSTKKNPTYFIKYRDLTSK